MPVRFPWLGLLAATVLLLGVSQVAAQEWLSDRARTEGRGIRLGDFELHPGIGAEGGYDTNIYLSETPQDSVILRVAPHIYLSTLGEERLSGEVPPLTFRTGARATFKYYFAPEEGDIGLGQEARLVWTAGIFSWELFDVFNRSIDPFTEAAAPNNPDAEQLNFERDQFGVGTRLQLSTPGGLMKVGLGYRFDIDYFEDQLFEANRNHSHTIAADTSWEFLPKTAFFWNGTLMFHRFSDEPGALGSRADSTRVSSKVGINGALTSRVGFTVATGYGAGFFEDDNDYESVLAQIEVRWRLRETMLWALGYEREFNTAFQGGFARMDRIKTRLQAMLGGVFLLGAKAELTFVDFGFDDDPNIVPDPTRNDIHLLTGLSGEYRVIDWFAITTELNYIQNFTDAGYIITDPGPPPDTTIDEAKYKRFEVWLGVRAFL